MKEIDFDPSKMTRATASDIERMYFVLWGKQIILEDEMTIWNRTKSRYEGKMKVGQTTADRQLDELKLFIEQKKLCNQIVTDCTAQVSRFTSAISGAYIVDDADPINEAERINQEMDAQDWARQVTEYRSQGF